MHCSFCLTAISTSFRPEKSLSDWLNVRAWADYNNAVDTPWQEAFRFMGLKLP